ncbi:uncharacterized protein cubi_02988 [Cryptosporidium ubiquitum]|uniref:Uncharacterized protein n=1 Tax=Cryptosporidium ubiquitum TaxID=857276 RepID=A0A1J4MKW7_9CRYT|nr:uncharacterized protein cubi_02988 [Cryptosporidium ubiquitum]OII74856.1 hypothetical protein cubi_02988 [Cryptosporidium ubiquitum]
MNEELKNIDSWRGSVTGATLRMNNPKINENTISFFRTGTFNLLIVQIIMISIMCIFIFIGVSLHVVKLKKIHADEYMSHFNLDINTSNILMENLKSIERSMGQMSFFKVLKSNLDLSIPNKNSKDGNIIFCGGIHKRGTNWSEEVMNATKKTIEIALGNGVLIEFKRGLVFAINAVDIETNNIGINQDHLTQPNNSSMLFKLFLESSGYVSPCYMFGKRLYSYILGKNSGFLGYLMVTLPWFFSILSPQPMLLVHFPRLIIYILIAMHRVVFLHMIINVAEKKLFSFDFSDHIVLYAMYILIISIEWCAAGYNIKNKLVVSCIRGYCLSLLAVISYSSFFTALYFHFPLETLAGFIIAFFGLFGVFWILIFLDYIDLSKIGLNK